MFSLGRLRAFTVWESSRYFRNNTHGLFIYKQTTLMSPGQCQSMITAGFRTIGHHQRIPFHQWENQNSGTYSDTCDVWKFEVVLTCFYLKFWMAPDHRFELSAQTQTHRVGKMRNIWSHVWPFEGADVQIFNVMSQHHNSLGPHIMVFVPLPSPFASTRSAPCLITAEQRAQSSLLPSVQCQPRPSIHQIQTRPWRGFPLIWLGNRQSTFMPQLDR